MNETLPELRQAVHDDTPRIQHDRRIFHAHPELGWQEYWTASKIVQTLLRSGIETRWGREVLGDAQRLGLPTAAQAAASEQRAVDLGADIEIVKSMRGGLTAVVGRVPTGRPGPVLVLRFDIDGLPITESGGDDHRPRAEGFQSKNEGCMHACAHDAHIAIGLAIARLASRYSEHLRGELRLIFQPAEEGVRGASALVEAGEVDDATHFIATHLGLNGGPTGEVICGATEFFATEKYEVSFSGREAHAAASPEQGRNALLAAATATMNIHGLGSFSGAHTRVNVGCLEAGTSSNVVAGQARLLAEVRATTPEAESWQRKRFTEIVAGSAAVHGCDWGITTTGRAAAQNSDSELAEILKRAAGQSPSVKHARLHGAFGASDDATEYMKSVASSGGLATYLVVGASHVSDHHTADFDIDEAALPIAVELLMNAVYQILGRP